MTHVPPSPSVSAAPSAGRSTLYSLQVMRGIAALAVAVYHTHLILTQYGLGVTGGVASVATKGWIGVNFFFVLSGFIIMYAHARDIGRPGRAGRYLWRRFTRVYPVYWIFLTFYIAAAALGVGSPDFRWSGLNLLSAYMLVQLVPMVTLPLQVAWTLFCEITFYFAFLLLILNRSVGALLIGLWVATIIVIGPVLGTPEPHWFIHSWNLYFFAGIAAYLALQRIDPRHGVTILAAGVVLLATCFALGLVDSRIAVAQRTPMKLIVLVFPFTFILLGAALAETHHRWSYPRWLLLLGDASYAIYLVHSGAISALALIARHFSGGLLPPLLLYGIILLLAVVAGVLAHLIVERPLLAGIRRVEWGRRGAAPLRRDGKTI